MAGITLSQAETKLATALSAYETALENQSYSAEGISMSRQQLKSLQDAVEYWDSKVKELTSNSSGLIISQFSPQYEQ